MAFFFGMDEDEFTIKVCFLGTSGVGKTSICNKYQGKDTVNLLSTQPQPSSGDKKYVHNDKGETVKIILVDTAGQEKYKSLIPTYTRSADVILLVYDITDRSSFDDLDEFYRSTIDGILKDNIKFYLVGNKSDLETNRKVKEEDAKELQKKLNCIEYFETSVPYGVGIAELFHHIVNNCTEKADEIFSSVTINQNKKDQKQDNCC